MTKKPKEKPDKTHPSFGMINISRVSGHQRLYGSDFTHHHFISLTISTAREFDRYGAQVGRMRNEEIIDVYMSEAQFGRMISSLNMGEGTPCTLNSFRTPPSLKEFDKEGNHRIPQLEQEDIRKTHKDDIKEMVQERMEDLEALEERMSNWNDSKHRPTLTEMRQLVNDLRCLHMASNFAFFQETLEEKMEKTIKEGHTEIEAHADLILRKLGLDAVHRKALPEITDGSQKRLGTADDPAGEDSAGRDV